VKKKKCSKCGRLLSLKEFHRKMSHQDGRQSYCKECSSKICILHRKNMTEEQKERKREWGFHHRHLRKYGLTSSAFSTLLRGQKNRCAICRHKFTMDKKPAVDHDHKTGKVRGLLCTNCNRVLGNAKDDVNVLFTAIQYLESGEKWRWSKKE